MLLQVIVFVTYFKYVLEMVMIDVEGLHLYWKTTTYRGCVILENGKTLVPRLYKVALQLHIFQTGNLDLILLTHIPLRLIAAISIVYYAVQHENRVPSRLLTACPKTFQNAYICLWKWIINSLFLNKHVTTNSKPELKEDIYSTLSILALQVVLLASWKVTTAMPLTKYFHSLNTLALTVTLIRTSHLDFESLIQICISWKLEVKSVFVNSFSLNLRYNVKTQYVYFRLH